jgi:hypothetical protein
VESIWHIGFAVPGLEKGKKELGDVFGLSWRPTRVRNLRLIDAYGPPYDVECHVAFSLGVPFAVEVWQAIPGTPLDIPESGGVHHIGYWVLLRRTTSDHRRISEPADWLEVFETDVRDPLDTYARATSPMPSASARQPELTGCSACFPPTKQAPRELRRGAV